MDGTKKTSPMCSHCHKVTPDLYVCGRVECLQLICSVCRPKHDHARELIHSDKSDDIIRPYMDINRRRIKDALVKMMSRKAKSSFETSTRLDKTAEIKRDIKSWCSRMYQIIDEAEAKLLSTIETMEREFEMEARSSKEELSSLEEDYKSLTDLQMALTNNKISTNEKLELFTLTKKYEAETLDSNKSTGKNWEQTYMSFIPNEESIVQLRNVAYDCGKIKCNLQLTVDTEKDRSGSGLSGMTLLGDNLAIADKFNRCIKMFSCPRHCGLGGEAAKMSLISKYYEGENHSHFTTPVDLAYDPESKILLVVDEQENCVIALNADDAKIQFKLEMKRPNRIALSSKLIIVSSEYEKVLTSFKRSNNKRASSILLKDHPLSIATNSKADIAMCTLHGVLSIMNSDLKEQFIMSTKVDGHPFQPQRVCGMHNDRFLACDTQRVIEVQPNGVVKRTVLIAGMPGTSIPELPRSLVCDKRRNIFMGFGRYVKVFPVPMEVSPPEDESESNSTNTSETGVDDNVTTNNIK